MEEKEIHLVKKLSKELGMTYKQLGEEIGYTEAGLKNLVFKNQVTKNLKKSIELYLENLALKEEIKETNELIKTIKTFMNKKSLY